MEEALKSKQMSSVSARRKRFQERQQEHRLEHELMLERKRQMRLHDQSSSTTPTTDHFDYESLDRQSSTDTASECSVQTPDERSPPSIFTTICDAEEDSSSLSAYDELHVFLDQNAPEKKGLIGVALPSPRPRMLSSLTKTSDFFYDRFSMFIDDRIELPQEARGEDELHAEDDELPSPIETAVSVTYSKAQVRPSVILVTSFGCKNKSRVLSTQSSRSIATIRPGAPSPRIETDLSLFSGFLASEAKELEIPDLVSSPEDQLHKVDSILPSPSDVEETPFRLGTQPSAQPTIAARRNHKGIDNLKSIMKPSSRPVSRAGSIALLSNNSSLTESPRASSRPGTSHSRRSSIGNLLSAVKSSHKLSSQSSVMALPIPPSPSPSQQSQSIDRQELQSAETQPSRKKSFGLLRRRSESISLAFKSLSGSKSKLSIRPDVPALPTSIPTTPTSMKSWDLGKATLNAECAKISTSKRSVDLGTVISGTSATAAPPSLRPSTKNGPGYFQFPAPSGRSVSSSDVGLGLKRVESVASLRDDAPKARR